MILRNTKICWQKYYGILGVSRKNILVQHCYCLSYVANRCNAKTKFPKRLETFLLTNCFTWKKNECGCLDADVKVLYAHPNLNSVAKQREPSGFCNQLFDANTKFILKYQTYKVHYLKSLIKTVRVVKRSEFLRLCILDWCCKTL